MGIFNLIITSPLGYLLGFIYSFVKNYGLALILFTLVIKLVLLPLNLKQQKSMTKMQKIQPKIKEVQDKYKNDQQRQAEEMRKLYKTYDVSPMGGCLPLLLQMPILVALYSTLYKPLTYIYHCWDASQITQMLSTLGADANNRMAEIIYANANHLINFDFLGLDLSLTPNYLKPGLIWIIPILATVTTYLSSKLMTMINNTKKDKKENDKEKKPQRVLNPDPKQNKSENSAEGMTKSMALMAPLMTLWVTFTLPAALGLYWIIGNVFSIFQTLILNNHYSRKFSSEIEEKNQMLLIEKKERQKRKNNRG